MLTFTSSDLILQAGFVWAKVQALGYAHHGKDPVGLWYEAALPGRDAFCIRDAAHQRAGASVLGLKEHTYNMFRKFAESIHPARDYCMYWEIDKKNRPVAVDYTDDSDFWYNLPANFDLLQACHAEALWTGDTRYLREPCFRQLEALSFNEYIAAWDRNGDGIPEGRPEDGRRGVASYNEMGKPPLIAGDLLGAMFAAYIAVGQKEKALVLQEHYLREWYNEKRERFYGAKNRHGQFIKKYCREGNFLPVYFGLLDSTPYLLGVLKDIHAHGAANVEAKTYFPQMYYGRGFEADALRELHELCDPALKRREYPEVSFAVVGTLINQYLGLTVPEPGLLQTLSGVPQCDWAQAQDIPVLGTEISLRQEGQHMTSLKADADVRWRACFLGAYDTLTCNGEPLPVEHMLDAIGRMVSFVEIQVAAGKEMKLKVLV